MGCASSKDVLELKEGIIFLQEQQGELLKAVEGLAQKLENGGSEGLSPEQIEIQRKASEADVDMKTIADSVKSLEKVMSLLLVKTYEPVTKVIERKHKGIRKLTEQIVRNSSIRSPDGRAPAEILSIQEKLKEVEAKFADLTSPQKSE